MSDELLTKDLCECLGVYPEELKFYLPSPISEKTISELKKLVNQQVLSVLAELKKSLNDGKQSHSVGVINAAIEEQERRFKS